MAELRLVVDNSIIGNTAIASLSSAPAFGVRDSARERRDITNDDIAYMSIDLLNLEKKSSHTINLSYRFKGKRKWYPLCFKASERKDTYKRGLIDLLPQFEKEQSYSNAEAYFDLMRKKLKGTAARVYIGKGLRRISAKTKTGKYVYWPVAPYTAIVMCAEVEGSAVRIYGKAFIDKAEVDYELEGNIKDSQYIIASSYPIHNSVRFAGKGGKK